MSNSTGKGSCTKVYKTAEPRNLGRGFAISSNRSHNKSSWGGDGGCPQVMALGKFSFLGLRVWGVGFCVLGFKASRLVFRGSRVQCV